MSKNKKASNLSEESDQKPVIDGMVRSRGLEPPRLFRPLEPESSASANSATTAC
jgi:hypothetical protein